MLRNCFSNDSQPRRAASGGVADTRPEVEVETVQIVAVSHGGAAEAIAFRRTPFGRFECGERRTAMDIDELSLVAEHFDSTYYTERYPDVANAIGGDKGRAVGHYVMYGWAERRDPAPWFSTAHYLDRYGDINTAGVNPFLHYLQYGRTEGRVPLPHFEDLGSNFDYQLLPRELLRAAKEFDRAAFMVEYHSHGELGGFELSRAELRRNVQRDWRDLLRDLIDETWIEKRYGVDSETFIRSFASGELGLQAEPNAMFDAAWYAASQGLAIGASALRHYLDEGWLLGENPGPYFDTSVYLSGGAGIGTSEPLGHFVQIGRFEGRLPIWPSQDLLCRAIEDDRASMLTGSIRTWFRASGILDADWYAWFNDLPSPDHSETHYWAVGFKQLLRPNPYFDPEWYLRTYPEVLGSGWSPVMHYAIRGWVENKNPSRFLNTERFREVAGEGMPFTVLTRSGVVPGSIAPAYPDGTPGADSSINLSRQFAPQPLVGPSTSYNETNLSIHWLIPDFGPGGGGHTNIFRMARLHQERGHRSHVWVVGPRTHHSKAQLEENANEWYGPFAGEIDFLPEGRLADEIEGDVLIATAWQTALPARSLRRFRRRFYFVQDFEPMFYPAGSMSYAALETYSSDFDYVCASPWLADKMQNEFDLWASSFLLMPNHELYYPPKNRPQNTLAKIVVYAREGTTRRCVELLQAALLELACRGVAFQVYAFGISPETTGRWRSLGVPVEAHQVVPPPAVADQYRSSDLGIALSATNYSLVPPEMMACGLPVVDLRVDATIASYADGVAALAPPTATGIADTIESLLDDPEARRELSERGRAWVSELDWHRTADDVLATFKNRIAAEPVEQGDTSVGPLSTVVIPTLNAAAHLEELFDALDAQETDWEFEVLVVDSASEDDTVQISTKRGARVIQIDRRNFQHGRTRNLAVQSALGDFVAFLTQDAIPDTEDWLANLVQPMLDDSTIAGCFGRHRAHNDASPFTVRELETHFDGFLVHPQVVSRNTDRARYDSGDPGWRQLLYFYSDNNSCLRKSVWRDMPYPAVKFGEDQAWAQLIIDAGLRKAYADGACVRHSHDFGPEEARYRAWEEAQFFAEQFGLLQLAYPADVERVLRGRITEFTRIADEMGLDASVLSEKIEVESARLEGVLYGSCQLALPAFVES